MPYFRGRRGVATVERMKALCVKAGGSLELRDVPAPEKAALGHVILRSAGSAINPGDKFFLKNASMLGPRQSDVWGASGAGTVLSVSTCPSTAAACSPTTPTRSTSAARW